MRRVGIVRTQTGRNNRRRFVMYGRKEKETKKKETRRTDDVRANIRRPRNWILRCEMIPLADAAHGKVIQYHRRTHLLP